MACKTGSHAEITGPRVRAAAQRLDAFTRFHIRCHQPRGDQVFVAYMELRDLTPGERRGGRASAL